MTKKNGVGILSRFTPSTTRLFCAIGEGHKSHDIVF